MAGTAVAAAAAGMRLWPGTPSAWSLLRCWGAVAVSLRRACVSGKGMPGSEVL